MRFFNDTTPTHKTLTIVHINIYTAKAQCQPKQFANSMRLFI